jgi:hypothetical protein
LKKRLTVRPGSQAQRYSYPGLMRGRQAAAISRLLGTALPLGRCLAEALLLLLA